MFDLVYTGGVGGDARFSL